MGRIFIDSAEIGHIFLNAVILVTQSLKSVYINLPTQLTF